MRFSLRRRATAMTPARPSNGGNGRREHARRPTARSSVAVAEPPAGAVRRDWESLPAMQLTVSDAQAVAERLRRGPGVQARHRPVTPGAAIAGEIDAPSRVGRGARRPHRATARLPADAEDHGSPLPRDRAAAGAPAHAGRRAAVPTVLPVAVAAVDRRAAGEPAGRVCPPQAAWRHDDRRGRSAPPAATRGAVRRRCRRSSPPAPRSIGPRHNLADSRRMGLGPAYHGSLPEAMHDERTRSRAECPKGVREVDPADARRRHRRPDRAPRSGGVRRSLGDRRTGVHPRPRGVRRRRRRVARLRAGPGDRRPRDDPRRPADPFDDRARRALARRASPTRPRPRRSSSSCAVTPHASRART